jgi:hypothetical protein
MACARVMYGGDAETAKSRIMTEKEAASLWSQISNLRILDCQPHETGSIVRFTKHA